jgi:Importin-beta N-terminal domain
MADVEAFRHAVQRMYGSSDRTERKDAEHWLEHWQRQSQAWSTADAILHDPSSSEEQRYMAAQTIRTKVSHQIVKFIRAAGIRRRCDQPERSLPRSLETISFGAARQQHATDNGPRAITFIHMLG